MQLSILHEASEGTCGKCGRCCVAVSINSKLPNGRTFNKPRGQKCQHLTVDNTCGVWGDEERQPSVCRTIKPTNDLCRNDLDGTSQKAKTHYKYLTSLDRATTPD